MNVSFSLAVGIKVSLRPHPCGGPPHDPWPSVLAVFVLAVLANICYCAAYIVDLTVQYSEFRDPWRKQRWVLWAVGVAFAGVLTYYWIADEIFPSVA